MMLMNNNTTGKSDRMKATLISVLVFGLILASPPLHALDKVRLQLRFDHQFQFAGYYAAQWQGYYADADLEVDILSGVRANNSMVSATEVVRHGGADFGIGAGDILLTIDQGTPLTVVASILQQSPVELFARASAKLTSPADLTRLKVLVDPSPLIRAEILAMLHAEGIAKEAVNFIPYDGKLPVTDRIQALMRGEIDVVAGDDIHIDIVPGYALSIPWYAKEQGIALTSLKPAAYGVDFYGDSLFTTTRLARENPELVQRFRDASLKGWEYAMAHPVEIADRIASELPRQIPVTDLRAYNRFLATRVSSLMHYPIIDIGHVNPLRWQRMHQALLAAKLVNNPWSKTDLFFDPERISQQHIQSRLTGALEIAVITIIILSLFSVVYLLRAKRRVEENERRYKGLFDDCPVSIWEEDFSATKVYLDEQLSASKLPVRELLESRPDIVEECAKRVRVLNVNHATLVLYRANTANDLLRGLPATFTDESFIAFREELISLVEGNANFQTEAVVKTIRGEKIYIGLYLSILPAARKNWERVVILSVDNTARKRAEELLGRYKIMVSATTDMMAYVSKDYRYLTVNESYLKSFREDENTIVGKHIGDLLGVEMFERVKPQIEKCLAGEHISYEMTMQFPGSGLRFVRVNYHPAISASGVIDGLVVHLHDLTDIKKMEHELLEHRHNLEQQVEDRTLKLTQMIQELEAFSYAVSHDLRAPLRSINGFSAALLESHKEQLDVQGRDYLARINKNTLKMGEQIEGMLSLSRITRSELTYSIIDVSAMVHELADKFQEHYAGSQAEVSIQPDIKVYGDQRLIEIALDNIISNAFKFSSRVAMPRIEIGCTEEDGMATLYIKDNGVGYDMKYADKLFAVFQRLQTDYDGTGIGLATVQRVIIRHGGKLWAESSPGQGAVFYIGLPTKARMLNLVALAS